MDDGQPPDTGWTRLAAVFRKAFAYVPDRRKVRHGVAI